MRTTPIRDGLVAGLALVLIASVSTGLIYFRATRVFSEQIREELSWLARAAASLVDGDIHKTLRLPEQEKTQDYEKAVTPLRQVLAALPEVRFIYTVVLEPDGALHFVLDSVAVGDKDGDGVQDHSFLMDVYEDPDQELIEASKHFDVRVSKKPYTDEWGTFISAYAPIVDSAKVPVGIVGVDINAKDYLRRLRAIHHAVLTGFLFQFLISGLVGFLVYFLRRNALQGELNEKKLQAQLLQSQKMEMIGTLAGGIAHDLNNQMTPLRGYLDILLQEFKSDTQNYPMILEASDAAVRCSDIVRRLLNFSKPSVSEDKSVIRISDLLNEMKRLFHSFLPATIQAEVFFEDDLPSVYGNETELQTVLVNLTTNARDAMPKGGSLRIEAKKSGAQVVILVTDSGQGIAQEVISKIFDPFFSTKEKSKGAGLGLAMVFGIIKSHGGSISVSSVVGKGSVFEITLPAHDPAMNPVRPATAILNSQPEALRGNETILFVDDEKSLRDLGKTILERLGYKVVMASDGEEAVETYRQKRSEIAVVLMDMTMPKFTGRETMEQLLKINPKVKIILATGFTGEGSAQELIAAGAKELIQKPYTASIIAQKIRKVLDC